jgi:hypothetical protein
MSAPQSRTARWSEEDDRLLRAMSEAGKSLTLMTVKLNRPMASIKARAADLGIAIAGTGIGKRKREGLSDTGAPSRRRQDNRSR